jgi:hypothetical protein
MCKEKSLPKKIGNIFCCTERNCPEMSCRIFSPCGYRKIRYAVICSLLVAFVLFTAGCLDFSGENESITNATQPAQDSVVLYKVTINQPDAFSGYIKMDTDIYNTGEVVEFTVTNDGTGTLDCEAEDPFFAVKTQTPGGAWITKMAPGQSDRNGRSTLSPGDSTQSYAFVTTGWEPGRYRIVHDCGIEHEFLLRALPVITPAPETPAPETCPEVDTSKTAPWIAIEEILSPVAYQPFTIQGTTNLPAGQELVYTIFAVEDETSSISLDNQGSFRTTVIEGSCGINTWAATGEIQASGEFAIGIMGTDGSPSAIRRFFVVPE